MPLWLSHEGKQSLNKMFLLIIFLNYLLRASVNSSGRWLRRFHWDVYLSDVMGKAVLPVQFDKNTTGTKEVHSRVLLLAGYTQVVDHLHLRERGRADPASRAGDHHSRAIREIVAPSGGQARVALGGNLAWSHVHDTLEPLGVYLFLTHPKRVKAVTSAEVKTGSKKCIALQGLTTAFPTQRGTCEITIQCTQGFDRILSVLSMMNPDSVEMSAASFCNTGTCRHVVKPSKLDLVTFRHRGALRS